MEWTAEWNVEWTVEWTRSVDPQLMLRWKHIKLENRLHYLSLTNSAFIQAIHSQGRCLVHAVKRDFHLYVRCAWLTLHLSSQVMTAALM